jgi:hypothetical protein
MLAKSIAYQHDLLELPASVGLRSPARSTQMLAIASALRLLCAVITPAAFPTAMLAIFMLSLVDFAYELRIALSRPDLYGDSLG